MKYAIRNRQHNYTLRTKTVRPTDERDFITRLLYQETCTEHRFLLLSTFGRRGAFWNSAIRRSVCLSHGATARLGYRHAGCLQLSHHRPPEMCGLRTRPRTDVDPPRFVHPRRPDWRRHDRYATVELPSVGSISSRRRRGDILYSTIYWTTCNKRTC